mgnify:CR=1 FL=1
MGICGTAMAHVALLLREMGHIVSGVDGKFFDPIATLLKKSNVQTYEGYNVDRLKQLSLDLVIVGNAISRGNVELEYLLRKRIIPFYSFPEFLSNQLFRKRNMWVVTGTHGKTTTTSLLAFLLKTVCKPGYLIGGLPKNFTCGCSLGDDIAPFVIEGDEYDTAFFDKRSKFFHYWPRTLIINNLEFDHADIFRDIQEVQRSFYQLTRLLPDNGHLILNGDDDMVKALLPCNWTSVHTVGFGEENDWCIDNFFENKAGISFDVCNKNKTVIDHISVPLLGRFNARNIAMAYVACYVNGVKVDVSCLKMFGGVARRQKIVKQLNECIIMEDFGHHPTAIHSTLEALRRCYPLYKIVACFEPACNTSASSYFQEKSIFAFENSDEVWLLPAKDNLYSDRFVHENGLSKINLLEVKQLLNGSICNVELLSNYEELCQRLNNLATKTLVCCFSNGRLSSILDQWSRTC